MKKFILIIISIISLIGKSFSEQTVYEELLNKIKATNKNLLLNNLENNIKKRNILNDNLKWLPQVNLENSCLIFGELEKFPNLESSIVSNLAINQKLLLGSSLSLYGKNSLTIRKEDKLKFNHQFSTGAQLKLPIYFFAMNLFVDALKNDFYYNFHEKNILQLNTKALTNTTISNIVFTTGKLIIQEEKITINDKMITILEKINTSNKILWEKGNISTIELHKKLLDYEKNLANFTNDFVNLNILETSYKNFGLEIKDKPENLENWLDEWEKLLENINIEKNIKFELEKSQLESNWQNTISSYVQKLPSLVISCQFNNIEPTQEPFANDWIKSIKDTFSNNVKYSWSVNVGMNISFNTFSEKFQLNQNFKETKAIYELQKQILFENQEAEIIREKNTIRLLEESIKNKEKNYKLTKDYERQAEILANSGVIHKNEYDLQKLYTEQAKQEVLEARLERICYLLKYY